jgi:hypothetical protein
MLLKIQGWQNLRKAEELEADSLYQQFKTEMNIDISSPSSGDNKDKQKEQSTEKTIG